VTTAKGVPVADSDRDVEFTEFVRAASPGLLHTAWLLCGDPHRAEDLVQTALVRTYGAWRRVRREEATAYARRILVNANTDWWRRRPWREQPTDAPPDRPAGPDHTGRTESRDALVRALGRLGPRERAVVVLRYYADLELTEVADLLGITVGTVKSAASRALAKLRVSAELTETDSLEGAR
jgi:RNA polymerase sigma-70 factor (sigma-E family)